jgi:hypothetical protein
MAGADVSTALAGAATRLATIVKNVKKAVSHSRESTAARLLSALGTKSLMKHLIFTHPVAKNIL